jgi:hypothetical protein
MRIHPDRKILKVIYDRYYDTFVSFQPGSDDRHTKNYVPVDLQRIADVLRVDGDIVFGRLYYHLSPKY